MWNSQKLQLPKWYIFNFLLKWHWVLFLCLLILVKEIDLVLKITKPNSSVTWISTSMYSVIIMNLPLPRIGAVFRSESLSCLIPKGSMFGTMRKAKDMTRTTRQVLACGLHVLDRTKACSFFSCCNRCLKTILDVLKPNFSPFYIHVLYKLRKRQCIFKDVIRTRM